MNNSLQKRKNKKPIMTKPSLLYNRKHFQLANSDKFKNQIPRASTLMGAYHNTKLINPMRFSLEEVENRKRRCRPPLYKEPPEKLPSYSRTIEKYKYSDVVPMKTMLERFKAVYSVVPESSSENEKVEEFNEFLDENNSPLNSPPPPTTPPIVELLPSSYLPAASLVSVDTPFIYQKTIRPSFYPLSFRRCLALASTIMFDKNQYYLPFTSHFQNNTSLNDPNFSSNSTLPVSPMNNTASPLYPSRTSSCSTLDNSPLNSPKNSPPNSPKNSPLNSPKNSPPNSLLNSQINLPLPLNPPLNSPMGDTSQFSSQNPPLVPPLISPLVFPTSLHHRSTSSIRFLKGLKKLDSKRGFDGEGEKVWFRFVIFFFLLKILIIVYILFLKLFIYI
jgi:hypothetical protein